MQTLKGRTIYSQLRLIDPISAPLQDKNGEDYWRMSFGKKVFIIREDVAKAFEAAEIAEFNLEDNTRTVEIEGVATEVAGVQYAGHLSYKQALAITKNEGELIKLENSYLVKASTEEVAAA